MEILLGQGGSSMSPAKESIPKVVCCAFTRIDDWWGRDIGSNVRSKVSNRPKPKYLLMYVILSGPSDLYSGSRELRFLICVFVRSEKLSLLPLYSDNQKKYRE